MGSVTAAIVLASLLALLLRQQRAQQRRAADHSSLSREELLPHHYQSFTDLENRLWAATNQPDRRGAWDDTRFKLGRPEGRLVRAYLDALSQDFRRGHRIFGQVILHAPEGELFARLERERLRIELSYYFWRALIWVRLNTAGISVRDLRCLTETVATLAHRVRIIVNALEAAGQGDALEALLKNS